MTRLELPTFIRVSVVGTFILMLIGLLYFAKGFFIPVTVAFLMALVFSPVIRRLGKIGIPSVVGAFIIVLLATSGIFGIVFALSTPLAEMIDDAPRIGFELERKLAGIGKPIKAVKEAEKTISKATSETAEPGVQEVIVRERGFLSQIASGAPEVLASIALAIVLLLFLLASGDLFYVKLVRSFPRMTDKKRWLKVVYDVERDVSNYLFTISLINLGLGICIFVGLYLVDMPDPLLWGVAAAILNFIPYVGPAVGVLALTVTSILAFPTLSEAILPPVIYLALNSLEGQFVTPALLGRRLQINAVIVFLAIAFWGWLWGAVGVFVAVPILIVIKTFTHHAEGMVVLEEFLSVLPPPPEEDERENETLSSNPGSE